MQDAQSLVDPGPLKGAMNEATLVVPKPTEEELSAILRFGHGYWHPLGEAHARKMMGGRLQHLSWVWSGACGEPGLWVVPVFLQDDRFDSVPKAVIPY